jgi:hypothetical protein
LNRAEVLTGALSVAHQSADAVTAARNALFSISDRREGLYLVLRVERVLQGDPEEYDEAYLKDKPVRSILAVSSVLPTTH